jgi:sialic acid synthase SpsE
MNYESRFVKALKAGGLITNDGIRSVRPGFGLAPKYLDEVVGRYLNSDVTFGTAVSWDHLKGR